MSTKLLAYIPEGQALAQYAYGLSDSNVQNYWNAANSAFNGSIAPLNNGIATINVSWAGIWTPFKLTTSNVFSPQGSTLAQQFGTGIITGSPSWILKTLGSPIATSTAGIMALTTLPASGTTTVTTGFTQPDVPRVCSITGNASGIAGNVVINGLLQGVAVTDTIALSGTSTVAGLVVMDTIVSVVVPAKTNSSGDQVSVGLSAKLGIMAALARNTVDFTQCTNNGVQETAAPTVVTSPTNLSLNTVLLGSTLAGHPVWIGYTA